MWCRPKTLGNENQCQNENVGGLRRGLLLVYNDELEKENF